MPFLKPYLCIVLAAKPPAQYTKISSLGAAMPPPDPHHGNGYLPLSVPTKYGVQLPDAADQAFEIFAFRKCQQCRVVGRLGQPLDDLHIAQGVERCTEDHLLE